jgi:hypothetical protein
VLSLLSRGFGWDLCFDGERSDEDVRRGEGLEGGEDLLGEGLLGEDRLGEDLLDEEFLALSFQPLPPLRLDRRFGPFGGVTYPSCGVECRPCDPRLDPLPWLRRLLWLSLLRLCISSACSTARLLLALSDADEDVRRCLLLLLRRDIGGLMAVCV